MGLLKSLKGVNIAAGAGAAAPAPQRNSKSPYRRFTFRRGAAESMPRPEGVSMHTPDASGGTAASELGKVLRQAVGCDEALRLVDLSDPKLGFASMPFDKQETAIKVLIRARKVQAVWLPGVGLNNTHARAVAALLRGHTGLQALSLERNALTEPGLLTIAAAIAGHPTLSEVRLGEQQQKRLTSEAATRLVEAMEQTPTLTTLGLDQIPDAALAARLVEGRRLPWLRTAPRPPPWTIRRLGPLLRTDTPPERLGGLPWPPPPAPTLSFPRHLRPPGSTPRRRGRHQRRRRAREQARRADRACRA